MSANCFMLTIFSILAVHIASAEIFVYDGFDSAHYGTLSKNVQAIKEKGSTDNGASPIGFVADKKWGDGESNKTGAIYINKDPLSFPEDWDSSIYNTGSYAAGFCNSGNSTLEDQRGIARPLAGNAFPACGTFYFRILLRRAAECANAPENFYRVIGFLPQNFTAYGDAYASGETAQALFRSGLWLGSRQDADNEKIVLRLGDKDLVLLDQMCTDTTYLVMARVEIDADGDNEVASGFAVPVDFYVGPAWIGSSITSSVISVEKPLTHLCIVGAYKTSTEFFSFDEVMVTDSLMSAVPVSQLSIASSGAIDVGVDSVRVGYVLSAAAGAKVYLDYGLSQDAFPNTIPLEFKNTGAFEVEIPDLDFDTDYFWRFRAESGVSCVTSEVATVKTAGVPVIGSVSVNQSEQTASFTVAVDEVAVAGRAETSVYIFYGTSADNLSQSICLGSITDASTLQGEVTGLTWGEKYHYKAVATATVGERTVSATSAVASFVVLFSGDMYVVGGNKDAVPPYSTPGTAAPDIATAINASADGATIYVADGLYKIKNQLSISKSLRLVGNDSDPSRVVVSNTVSYKYTDSTHRCISVNNRQALVSGITFTHGQNGGNGGNVNIGANGGIVSNCIIKAGEARQHNQESYGSNVAIVGPGLLTHCRIYDGKGDGDSKTENSSVCLRHSGARAENCIIEGFSVTSNARGGSGLYAVKGAAINCTIVNCKTAAKTTEEKKRLFSGIRSESDAAFTNCVSMLNTDGNGILRSIRSDQSGRFFVNCAIDGIAGEAQALSGMEAPVVGTAADFFRDHANGDFVPKTGGPLVNAGADYDGMSATDLAGKARKIGKGVDIGCYECQSMPGFFLIVR